MPKMRQICDELRVLEGNKQTNMYTRTALERERERLGEGLFLGLQLIYMCVVLMVEEFS